MSLIINGEEHSSPSKLVVRSGSELVVKLQPSERVESTSFEGKDTRFVFDHWNDGDLSNPRRIVVNGDSEFSATMTKEYRIEVATNIGEKISASEWEEEGTLFSYTANDLNGYTFLAGRSMVSTRATIRQSRFI